MVILETTPTLLLFKLTERILSIHWLLGTLRLKKYLHGMRRKVLCKYKSTQSENIQALFRKKLGLWLATSSVSLLKLPALIILSHCYSCTMNWNWDVLLQNHWSKISKVLFEGWKIKQPNDVTYQSLTLQYCTFSHLFYSNSLQDFEFLGPSANLARAFCSQ